VGGLEVTRPKSVSPLSEPLIEARFDAAYLTNPKPAYPAASRRMGESGVVYLRVEVDAEGQVLQVEVKSSSGYSRLDRAAQETVLGWRFIPARRGKLAVASWVVVPINYSLN
jgi:protein TonB